MRALGIRPAGGDQLWFQVANPFVASIGTEELIGFTRRQLEKEYGVKIPDLISRGSQYSRIAFGDSPLHMAGTRSTIDAKARASV